MPDAIKVRGARTHNLRNVDVDIPRNRLVVVMNISGYRCAVGRFASASYNGTSYRSKAYEAGIHSHIYTH
jgi:hypothetical protein